MLYRLKKTCLLCLCILGLMVGMQVAQAAGTPMQALEEMQKAVDAKDYNRFITVVDVDGVVNAAMPEVMGVVQSSYRSGLLDLPPAIGFVINSLDMSDVGQQALASQLLGSEIKSLLATGVSGGYFAGDTNPEHDGSAYGSILSQMGQGRKSITGQRILHQTNERAKVSAIFEDKGTGFYPLVLGLVRQNNTWRIVSIENAKEIVEQIFVEN